jgi:hypothetical protein
MALEEIPQPGGRKANVHMGFLRACRRSTFLACNFREIVPSIARGCRGDDMRRENWGFAILLLTALTAPAFAEPTPDTATQVATPKPDGSPSSSTPPDTTSSSPDSLPSQTVTPPVTSPTSTAPAQTAAPTQAPAQTYPTTAQPLQNSVRLRAAPNVTLIVPKGWFACNDSDNQQLGGLSMPGNFKDKFCATQPPAPSNGHAVIINFRAINPNLAQLALVFGMSGDLPGLTPQKFSRLSQEQVEIVTDHICGMARRAQNFAAADCNLDRTEVDGHVALTGSLKGTLADNGMTMYMNIIMIPMDGSMLLFLLADTEASHSVTGPMLDAMTKSITIE